MLIRELTESEFDAERVAEKILESIADDWVWEEARDIKDQDDVDGAVDMVLRRVGTIYRKDERGFEKEFGFEQKNWTDVREALSDSLYNSLA